MEGLVDVLPEPKIKVLGVVLHFINRVSNVFDGNVVVLVLNVNVYFEKEHLCRMVVE